jgi:hypothetical protein
MKKQLLPKDLGARAEKVPAEKVEAEVLRIISAKPAAPVPRPGQILPWDAFQAQAMRQEMDRQARELERLYMADMQASPWMPPSLQQAAGNLWSGFTG